jgi:uncharacterized protein
MNLFRKIFIYIVFTLCCINIYAQNLPARPTPVKFVNDYTATLTTEQMQGLEAKLFELAKNTSTEIVVVIVPSTDGVTIADYNLALLRKWQVGSKKNNNGVILLIAKNDRKLDISVGYGLEGSLTDATALSIIEDVIVPKFKGNDYYRGVNDGVESIVQAVQGKYNDRREPDNYRDSGGSVIFILIFIFFILFLISRRGGGGGGAYMSRRGQRGIADAIFWNTVLGGGGGGWNGGGGGWSDGGGGGFGSFGGGSGGGGGASGSW